MLVRDLAVRSATAEILAILRDMGLSPHRRTNRSAHICASYNGVPEMVRCQMRAPAREVNIERKTRAPRPPGSLCRTFPRDRGPRGGVRLTSTVQPRPALGQTSMKRSVVVLPNKNKVARKDIERA